jgi:hypothetical protein
VFARVPGVLVDLRTSTVLPAGGGGAGFCTFVTTCKREGGKWDCMVLQYCNRQQNDVHLLQHTVEFRGMRHVFIPCLWLLLLFRRWRQYKAPA